MKKKSEDFGNLCTVHKILKISMLKAVKSLLK